MYFIKMSRILLYLFYLHFPLIKLPTFVGSSKKQEFQKKSALLTTPKPLTVWITTNCGKFLKRWEYQTTWFASWEICKQVRKQQLEPEMDGTMDWFQIRKGVCQGCILSPLFNLYADYIMQNAGLVKPNLESRLPGEISITSDMQMTPLLWQKAKKN